jgi:hypothetical protein
VLFVASLLVASFSGLLFGELGVVVYTIHYLSREYSNRDPSTMTTTTQVVDGRYIFDCSSDRKYFDLMNNNVRQTPIIIKQSLQYLSATTNDENPMDSMTL